jgi:hypothetical protein
MLLSVSTQSNSQLFPGEGRGYKEAGLLLIEHTNMKVKSPSCWWDKEEANTPT